MFFKCPLTSILARQLKSGGLDFEDCVSKRFLDVIGEKINARFSLDL